MIKGQTMMRAGLALCALLALPLSVEAQTYPDRTVKVIVPFPAGGTADAMPRIVAEFLTRKWGHPVIIENRAGAGGNVGAEAGLPVRSGRLHAVRRRRRRRWSTTTSSIRSSSFDPTQFIPIAVMGKVPNSILTNSPKLKDVKTVAEFVAYAKANPGALNSATQGIGTTAHLTSELFQIVAGRQIPAHPLSRLGSRRAGPGRRQRRRGVRQHRRGDGADQGRQAAHPRGVDRQARSVVAERADGRGNRAGLRGGDVVRLRRAAEDAAGDRRQDQRRHQRGAARSYRQARGWKT